MKIILTILLLLVVLFGGIGAGLYSYLSPEEKPPAIVSPSSVRTLVTGEIVGLRGSNGGHAWLGLPYAEPPVGPLRWRAPKRPETWTGRREAIAVESRCVQMSAAAEDGLPVGSEDCLYLNVWAPPFPKEELPEGDDALPVMFWIHGGGNSIGDGGSSIYDGSSLAVEHNVLVVTINYRLGPLGWFRHPALVDAGDSPLDASGNYGTLDIIAALEWVRANAAAFGGDPANVTIFGESAGAFDVLTMMVSPLAEGLFHKAIVQSGGLRLTPVAEAVNLEANGGDSLSSSEVIARLLVSTGRAATLDAARKSLGVLPAKEVRDLLRGLNPAELFSVYGGGFGGMIGGPKIIGDGVVLPANTSAEELFEQADTYNEVPVILGTNRDESRLFMMMNDEYVDKWFGLPVGIKDVTRYHRDTGYSSDLWKAGGVDELATRMSVAQEMPVYAYRFDADDWRNFGFIDLKELMGAAHALELPFVFGNFPNPLRVIFPGSTRPELELLSGSMMSYWAEFAHTGHPGKGRDGDEEAWLPWSNDDKAMRLLVLDTDIDAGIRMTNDRMMVSDVRKAFLADDTFTQAQHCAAYKRLFQGAQFDPAEYRELGESGCADAGN